MESNENPDLYQANWGNAKKLKVTTLVEAGDTSETTIGAYMPICTLLGLMVYMFGLW